MAERRRVAALATVVVVGFIALIWILSLSLSFANFFGSGNQSITPENSGIEAPYK